MSESGGVRLTSGLASGLAELLDTANAPIFAVDLTGAVTEWNFRVAELTSCTRDQAIQSHLVTHADTSCHADFQQALRVTLRSEPTAPFEMLLSRRGGGSLVRIMVGLSPQLGAGGEVVGALCVGQVMPAGTGEGGGRRAGGGGGGGVPGHGLCTEEGSDNRKLKGMVMHELRSPLHGIIGLSNTLSQDESPMQKPLKMIGSSAERVLELVTNLMDYWTLAEEPVGELAQDAIDVGALVSEVVSRCKAATDKRGKPVQKQKVELTTSMAEDVGVLIGDQQSLLQMLYHMVHNALKFTHQGKVTVGAMPSVDGVCVQLVVEDTGIGIHKENQNRIFEVFHQEDASESRKYEGIGLGLSIIREVVRIHGGKIDLQSQPDSGTTFTVRLPLRPDLAVNAGAPGDAVSVAPAKTEALSLEAPKAPPRGSGPRKAPGSWLGPEGQAFAAKAVATQPADTSAEAQASKDAEEPRAVATCSSLPSNPPLQPFFLNQLNENRQKVIMSVDDDHVNQEVMRSVLEPVGFKIVVCMNGFECLEYMEDTERTVMPDLILLDLMMPGINGFDVLQAQRKIYTQEQMPIIIVSAKNQVSSVVKGLELGCNDWIHKPFDRQELIARVKTQLRMKDTALGFQLLGAQMGQPPKPVEAVSTAPAPSRPPALIPADQIQETAALCTMLTDRQIGPNFHILPDLFAVFETLCEQHGIVRTEMFGSLFIAVGRAMDAVQGSEIVDRMLRLAFAMAEAVQQVSRDTMQQGALVYSMAIHYDVHGPPIIDGRKGGRPRQYPMSSLFGTTVHGAKRLCIATQHVGGILLSKNVCSRLSNDIKCEIQDRGLEVEAVPMSAAVALGSVSASFVEAALGSEFYTVVSTNGSPFGTLAFQQATAQHVLAVEETVSMSATMSAQPSGHGKPPLRRTHQELQEELWKAKQDIKAYVNQLSIVQQSSQTMEQQLLGSQCEARSLRAQLEESFSGGTNKDKARQNYTPLSETLGSLPNLQRHCTYQYTSGSLPTMEVGANEGAGSRIGANTKGSNGSAGARQNGPSSSVSSSLVFLQWQNARLQAEVRYLQDALALAKGQVLMHVNRSQAMERKHNMLQERVDHLELDLVLHSTHGGAMKQLHQGLPGALPLATSMPSAAGFACGGAGTQPAKTNDCWGTGGMGMGCGAMGPTGNNLLPNFASHQLNEVVGANFPGGAMTIPAGLGAFSMPLVGQFGSIAPGDPQAPAGCFPSI